MEFVIAICILILIAYGFDLTAGRTKIPSVILLMILGWGVQQFVRIFEIKVPDMEDLLPIFGTVGLILIVLEGGLGLTINSSKKKILRSALLSALIPLIILFFGLGFLISYISGETLTNGLINAVPFCIISSAIAIPSAEHLGEFNKEFVIYESSLSDIFGVILFNFLVSHEVINFEAFLWFFGQIIVMLIFSFFASIMLALLIKRIDHHVKFLPIILIIILIYSVSKIYHLPALLFILIFGLFLNNMDQVKRFKFVRQLDPEKLTIEVKRFKDLVGEFTFLIRTTFFILFGFLIDIELLADTKILGLLAAAVGIIFLIRFVQLKIFKMKLMPLLFIAPRGLITVILFLSIPAAYQNEYVNQALLLQIILLSALIMMFGLIFHKKAITND